MLDLIFLKTYYLLSYRKARKTSPVHSHQISPAVPISLGGLLFCEGLQICQGFDDQPPVILRLIVNENQSHLNDTPGMTWIVQ